MAQAPDPARQELLDALPVTGRITYEALRNALLSTGKVKAVGRFHDMRRDGTIKAEVETLPDGTPILYVSRP